MTLGSPKVLDRFTLKVSEARAPQGTAGHRSKVIEDKRQCNGLEKVAFSNSCTFTPKVY